MYYVYYLLIYVVQERATLYMAKSLVLTMYDIFTL